MCGIVGYIGAGKAQPVLIDGLSKLEYRGYDSAGVAIFDGEKINIEKAKGKLVNLENILDKYPLEGNVGIGHTRWATHGAPSDINSHPHASGDSKIAVVHNGIIENYIEIKEMLIKEGYQFRSETDTECVAQLVDFYYKRSGDFLDSVFKAVKELDGAYALGIICSDCPDILIGIRKAAPLIVGKGDGENFLASDIPAILKSTRDVYFLDDNEIAILKKDSVTICNAEREVVEREIYTVTWDVSAAEKDGYDHFKLKEINEQPRIIKETLDHRLSKNESALDTAFLELDKDELKNLDRIYIVACGTAYHAGLVGKHLIEKICRIPVIAEVASEFRYKDPVLDEKTLVIVVSQSGETADTLEALKIAKRNGSRVLAVVNAVGSSIAREADKVFYIHAGPEIAVASTKAFSAQVIAMYIITMHMAKELGKISDEDFSVLIDALKDMPAKTDAVISKSLIIKELADKYLNSKNVFFIGRGLDYVISQEGSLKLKEIAYLHSEAYAAGELKHGPIAMIEESTLVIAILTQNDLFEKTLSNIKEVKARGAKVIAITIDGNTKIETEADDVFYIPESSWITAPLLAAIPTQLFAYFVALGLGTDIDKPRNLAKSVTVE